MKKITKLSVITLTFCAVLTLGSTASDASIGFKDVDSKHWAYSYISSGVSKGFVKGYEDGTFKPSGEVTRAEFIKMELGALGIEVTPSTEGKWYEPFIAKAKEQGFLRDKDLVDTDFTKPILRKEMVKLLVAATDPAARKPGSAIGEEIAFRVATKNGLIKGLTNGDLGADKLTTRAEATVVIDRVMKFNNGEKLQVDKNGASVAEYNLTGTNVGTMFGLKLTEPLPRKLEFGHNLDVTLDKLLIIDVSTTNRPFKDIINDFGIAPDTYVTSQKNTYIQATHYIIKNKATTKYGNDYWLVSREIMPTYGLTTRPSDTKVLKTLGNFHYKDEVVRSGWYFEMVEKSVFDNAVANHDLTLSILNKVSKRNKLASTEE